MNDLLRAEVEEHPHPVLFATISGAHLYGFPSPDSDHDLRGAHVLPLREVVGLEIGPETVESSHWRDGQEIDLVTHDVRKFIRLMLRRNGYVLEQLYSPLVVLTTPEHEELKALGAGCITRWHANHYLGFARRQWALFEKEDPPRAKPLLYVYRVLLTGIHLMLTGRIEANLLRLLEEHPRPDVGDLVAKKTGTAEKVTLPAEEIRRHRAAIETLTTELEDARDRSDLPEHPTSRDGLDDLLRRVRLRA